MKSLRLRLYSWSFAIILGVVFLKFYCFFPLLSCMELHCRLLEYLLFLLAFPFSQRWPQRIIILQTFLSSTSVSFAPTSPTSSFTTSKNLLFGLPLLLFPGNSIFIIFLQNMKTKIQI